MASGMIRSSLALLTSNTVRMPFSHISELVLLLYYYVTSCVFSTTDNGFPLNVYSFLRVRGWNWILSGIKRLLEFPWINIAQHESRPSNPRLMKLGSRPWLMGLLRDPALQWKSCTSTEVRAMPWRLICWRPAKPALRPFDCYIGREFHPVTLSEWAN